MDTRSEWYANRLREREGKWWKRLIPVQAPYRWNLRRQRLGRTLDVGCGIGRNLGTLAEGSLGVDHNADAVAQARARGFEAVTVDNFLAGPPATRSFDGLLLAHVVEHMNPHEAAELLKTYLPFIKPGGRVFMICPQERGYASDPTHVSWTTGEDLAALARTVGLMPERPRSFPLPRRLGKAFIYNESTVLAVKPID
jgi:SAM-dependent methyltransferase